MNKLRKIFKKTWKGLLLAILLIILIGGSIYIKKHDNALTKISEEATTQDSNLNETEQETKKSKHKNVLVEETAPDDDDEWGPIR